MGSRVRSISKRNWNFTAGIASFLLVTYMGFLIVANYLSQLEIQNASLEKLRQNADKRAMALSYFYSERKNDLRALCASREISVFFENRDLGMSLQYGLRVSLWGIHRAFDKLLEEKHLGDDRIYNRIVFIDANGKLLVDTASAPLATHIAGNWQHLLEPAAANPEIILAPKESDQDVKISVAYYFKRKYVGQMVAWVSSQAVFNNFVKVADTDSSRLSYIASYDGYFFMPRISASTYHPKDLVRFAKLQSARTDQRSIATADGKSEKVLVCSVPIRETPFFLVSIVPAAEVFGHTPLWELPVAMAILSFLVLSGIAVSWRINSRNLVLDARLEQASKSKWEVEQKNQQLRREVAERKRMEAALRESEERYRRFFEEDLSGSFIATPGGRILACNPAFAEIFGFSSETEALQSDLNSLYLEPRRREAFLRLLSQEKKLQYYETEYRRVTGEIIQTVENVIGVFDDQGKLVEVKGFIIDNSERKKLEQQLRQSQKMEAIGTLAGGIAHDFNNILTAIIGYTEMAAYQTAPESRLQNNLQQVLTAAERAKDLVRQILTFSRQNAQEKSALQMSIVVKEALRLLRASLPATVEIRQKITAVTAMVFADATQVHQVLMNLCANAAYAMRGVEGVLNVSLEEVRVSRESAARHAGIETGSYVRLSVTDTGCGMDRHTMERIFEPFFTTKASGEGTGMGLAVVHGIVRSHGGNITVESEIGRGSSFHVFFPKIQDVPVAASPEPQTVRIARRSDNILLVDDEEPLLGIGLEMLQYLGYQVVAKSNSKEALATFKAQPDQFNLIITDYTMPKMNGIELARELMRIRPDIPIVLCTGYSDVISEELVKSMGIKEFVMKPYVFRELAEIIHGALNGKE